MKGMLSSIGLEKSSDCLFWNGLDFKATECTQTQRRNSGPKCLWCGLMGRTGERVPQLCVSWIFDGGSQRREQWGTSKIERWVWWELGGWGGENRLKHQIVKMYDCEWKCKVITPVCLDEQGSLFTKKTVLTYLQTTEIWSWIYNTQWSQKESQQSRLVCISLNWWCAFSPIFNSSDKISLEIQAIL